MNWSVDKNVLITRVNIISIRKYSHPIQYNCNRCHHSDYYMNFNWISSGFLLLKLVESLKFEDYLLDQFFPYQDEKIKSRIIDKLPKISGLYCDIESKPLK